MPNPIPTVTTGSVCRFTPMLRVLMYALTNAFETNSGSSM